MAEFQYLPGSLILEVNKGKPVLLVSNKGISVHNGVFERRELVMSPMKKSLK